MSRFFIGRPIVAMVIAIILVLLGALSVLRLPVSQFPNIAPPEIMLQGTYVGADALTLEQSVATPLEQQMSGVDRMLYMYSINGSNGQTTLRVDFDVATDPNVDQLLAHMRYAQAEPQLPKEVKGYGVTIRKSMGMPLVLFSLYSPNGTYDARFLANYAYINVADLLARDPGVGQVTIFGAGQYAMRLWVKPDHLAKLGLTVQDILNALKQQNVVVPIGQVGAAPVPAGQEFTYTVRTQGRLVTEDEFGDIILRANGDGSFVRLRDVGRAELGSQLYNFVSRLNGVPTAAIAVYQLPGSNAIETVGRIRALMAELQQRFPDDLNSVVSLDTTLAVTEGLHEILTTLWQAVLLVIVVVFLFLQNWRATLIPLLAVPVSLIGTFVIFPLLGFSINTLSLFGLVLAIGLVVDDAIVVVEAVTHHLEQGLAPREATLRAMEEVAGPVLAIALILTAVFVPTAFIPGITGRLYQQFAVTIAVSVLLSAVNALTLSPALAALLLKPTSPARGWLGRCFGWFNGAFGRLTERYVGLCGGLMQKAGRTLLGLALVTGLAGLLGARLPTGFIPLEDTGYFLVNVQLPPAASLQRTDAVMKHIDTIVSQTPGVEYYTTVSGYGILSQTFTTYNAVVFVALKPWAERTAKEERYKSIILSLNKRLQQVPGAVAFAFPPPAIPGVGTSGAVTFLLEDRAGRPFQFLAEHTERFLDAAAKRPEMARVMTTLIPGTPQWLADVDRDKALKQGVALDDLYQTLQTFMGGTFVNYFNRFGRLWQVYVEGEPEYRTKAEQVGQFYVRNAAGQMVPLSTLVTMRPVDGPEFTMRFNEYRAAQINAMPAPGYSSRQVMAALETVFADTMPKDMGFDYMGMAYQEQVAAEGVSPVVIFGFSLLFVFLILAAQYESWALPVSVLMTTPVSVFGAFAALWVIGLENDVYSQIGLVMLIGLSAKNAILIVEFARVEVRNGRPLIEAALTGARLRLRPILMTAFAFILGVLPLVLASGAGAHARVILGFTVLGGMMAATGLAILLIPVCYYLVERWLTGGVSRATGRSTLLLGEGLQSMKGDH
jgi:HAE1 family hydrophobic/amphiphilic exporter-1